jgi:hypothetical protein
MRAACTGYFPLYNVCGHANRLLYNIVEQESIFRPMWQREAPLIDLMLAVRSEDTVEDQRRGIRRSSDRNHTLSAESPLAAAGPIMTTTSAIYIHWSRWVP